MLRVCSYSSTNVRYLERRFISFVTSASDLPLHTIKLCYMFSSMLYVLFCSSYLSVLHAVINSDSLMRRRLCDKLHGRPSELLLARPAVIDR